MADIDDISPADELPQPFAVQNFKNIKETDSAGSPYAQRKSKHMVSFRDNVSIADSGDIVLVENHYQSDQSLQSKVDNSSSDFSTFSNDELQNIHS